MPDSPLLPGTGAGMRLSDSRDHHGHNCMRTFGGPCNCSLDAAILAIEAEARNAAWEEIASRFVTPAEEAKRRSEAVEAALAEVRRGVEALAEPTYDGVTWGTYESHGWGVALVAVLALLTPELRP